MSASSQLGEALTAGQVPALIQKRIDPQIGDLFRRFSQLVSAIPTKPWDTTVYNWNNRLSLPPGGFVRDGGARPMGNSVWEQNAVPLTNMQAVGSVTGFAQAVTRSLIGDLFREEYNATAQGLIYDMETALGWGSYGATQYGPWPQFDGLNSLVAQYTTTATKRQNAIDEGGAALSTNQLDNIIDLVRANAAMEVGSQYMFVMTPTAITRIEQLLDSRQRFVNQVEVAAGVKVSTYKNIPMVMSSFLGSAYGASMGTVVGSVATTGGVMAAGTWYYKIVPIMARAGMGVVSNEVTVTTTGSTATTHFEFATPTGPDQAMPLSYEVYKGTSTGQETLLGLVDAVVGLAADGITPVMATGITDTGATLYPTASAGATIPATYPPSYVGGGSQKVRIAGGEDIYLIPRDPTILCRPYVRDLQMLPVSATVNQPDALPLAMCTDTCLAVRAPRFVGRLRNTVSTLAA